jgi:hypothetical protein
MADDVVFLVHGREPMIGKAAYAAATRAMAAQGTADDRRPQRHSRDRRPRRRSRSCGRT